MTNQSLIKLHDPQKQSSTTQRTTKVRTCLTIFACKVVRIKVDYISWQFGVTLNASDYS